MPDQVVLVTGASRGIGAGIVAGFRERGWRVVACSRSMPASDDPGVAAIAGDVADPTTAERLVATALDRFGRIDTVVNNAGVFVGGPFHTFDATDYRTMVATNLDGFFHVASHAIRAMERQGSGHLVQITASLAEFAKSGVPSVPAAMTKGGLNAATRSLAVEYAGRGIRSNAVSLGVIRTPMHADESTHPALAEHHPLRRLGDVADVVRAVLFLEDSPFVTGEILHVDGGWVAGH